MLKLLLGGDNLLLEVIPVSLGGKPLFLVNREMGEGGRNL